MDHTYQPPLSRLLYIGPPSRTWRSYRGMGLTEANVAELFRMLRDRSLDDCRQPETWATLHAWRALAEFRVTELIPQVLEMLDEGDGLEVDEHLLEDFGQLAAKIGPDAWPFLKAYFLDENKDVFNRMAASLAIAELVRWHPGKRSAAIEVMESVLKDASEHFAVLNGIAIGALVDLGARESIELIRSVFRSKATDEKHSGSLEHVEFSLGFRERNPAEAFMQELLDEADTPEDLEAMDGMTKMLEWDPLESTCRHASLSIL